MNHTAEGQCCTVLLKAAVLPQHCSIAQRGLYSGIPRYRSRSLATCPIRTAVQHCSGKAPTAAETCETKVQIVKVDHDAFATRQQAMTDLGGKRSRLLGEQISPGRCWPLSETSCIQLSGTQYNLSSIVASRSGKLAYPKLTCCVGMYSIQRLESFRGTRSRSVLDFDLRYMFSRQL